METVTGEAGTPLATDADVKGVDTDLKDPTTSIAITPSDSTDLSATVTKGIWVGAGGNVALQLTGDSATTTLLNVPSGTFIPGRFKHIMAATTATSLVGFGG